MMVTKGRERTRNCMWALSNIRDDSITCDPRTIRIAGPMTPGLVLVGTRCLQVPRCNATNPGLTRLTRLEKDDGR